MNLRLLRLFAAAASLSLAGLAVAACGDDDDAGSNGNGSNSGALTVYSGRAESLVGPLIEDFEAASGIEVEVKYGDTAELAALLVEEGEDSPADVYFAQDAGALGAVSQEGLFEPLPESVLSKVDERFRSEEGDWVGVSGRSRVIVYNPDMIAEDELPDSVFDLTSDEWQGKVGWAPGNGSFQAFVTALRQLEGDDGAEQWLQAMKENDTKEYPNNVTIVSAVANGEITVGLVNHYYLWGFIRDQGEGFKARNHYTEANDPGSLVNVSGVGMLAGSDNKEAARQFVEFLVSQEAQEYFATQTFEYPLATAVSADPRLRPLSELDPPDIDLNQLQDLQGTVALLRETGVLP